MNAAQKKILNRWQACTRGSVRNYEAKVSRLRAELQIAEALLADSRSAEEEAAQIIEDLESASRAPGSAA